MSKVRKTYYLKQKDIDRINRYSYSKKLGKSEVVEKAIEEFFIKRKREKY